MQRGVSSSLPSWLRVRPPSGKNYHRIRELLGRYGLHTVCEEARCPNVAECWGGGTATFMVLGDLCTRGCHFCSVQTRRRGRPLDQDEPAHLAQVLGKLALSYVVLTSVCRDDLPDQGAGHFAECIRQVKRANPGILVEVLISDFEEEGLDRVLGAGPDVVAHNLETVERLTPAVRDPRAGYVKSLQVLRKLKQKKPAGYTKSSLMVGLGEKEEELVEGMRDLKGAGVDILTLGQYLRPSGKVRHLPVTEFVAPERFVRLREIALSLGFLYVASGPFVRSSYRAGEFFMEATSLAA
ncbi:MAG: lipoyl synthase [Elusimicrobia bacterium]|nr:lipoyl synthase [Elusimicrobiota bacterium]